MAQSISNLHVWRAVWRQPTGTLRLERKTNVRPLTMDDFDALVEMQMLCLPGMPLWSRDQVQSQIRIFPEGQLVVEIEGRLTAFRQWPEVTAAERQELPMAAVE